MFIIKLLLVFAMAAFDGTILRRLPRINQVMGDTMITAVRISEPVQHLMPRYNLKISSVRKQSFRKTLSIPSPNAKGVLLP